MSRSLHVLTQLRPTDSPAEVYAAYADLQDEAICRVIDVDELLAQARLDALTGARRVAIAIRLSPESRRRELARPQGLLAQAIGAIEALAEKRAQREAVA